MTTHQIILLDSSGSMIPCKDAIVSSFNELVQDVARRLSEGGEKVTVTLVTFGTRVQFVKFCEPADQHTPLTPGSYQPEGMTPLNDAIGAAIHRFKAEVPDSPDDRYLVAIVTDGIENASRHYSHREIVELIARRRSTGRWSFSMLGANQDLDAVSSLMGIARSQLVSFEPDEAGTIGGWKRLGQTMVASCSMSRDGDRCGTIYPWRPADDPEPSGAN